MLLVFGALTTHLNMPPPPPKSNETSRPPAARPAAARPAAARPAAARPGATAGDLRDLLYERILDLEARLLNLERLLAFHMSDPHGNHSPRPTEGPAPGKGHGKGRGKTRAGSSTHGQGPY